MKMRLQLESPMSRALNRAVGREGGGREGGMEGGRERWRKEGESETKGGRQEDILLEIAQHSYPRNWAECSKAWQFPGEKLSHKQKV